MNFVAAFIGVIFFVVSSFAQSAADFPAPSDLVTGPSQSKPPMEPAVSLGVHPTGAVGLFHTVSALTQPAGPSSFGIFAHANYFLKKDFPASAAANLITERFDSNFGVSYTPVAPLELFIGTGILNTNNEPPINPEITQTLNFNGGFKVAFPLINRLSVGAMYFLDERNAISTIPGSSFALNHTALVLATYRLMDLFRIHANLGYHINNNKRLTVSGTDPRQNTILRVYENNPLLVSLGFEYVHRWFAPSLEYSIDFVPNSVVGFADQPQRVSLSSRVFPLKSQALAPYVAVDIGLSKSKIGTPMSEPPLLFAAGIAYLFGAQKGGVKKIRTRNEEPLTLDEEPKKIAPTSSGKGVISGYVTNIESGEPIEGAKIMFCNDPARVVTSDSSGNYRSPRLSEESCDVHVEHEDYKPATETIEIYGDAQQTFDFGLLQEKKEKGNLLIRVKDVEGNPIPASISFPQNPEIKSIETNEFGQAKIPMDPGQYVVVASAVKKEIQTKTVDLSPGQGIFVDFALEPEPSAALDPVPETSSDNTEEEPALPTAKLSKDKKKIIVSEKINFEPSRSSLEEESKIVLDVVAAFLKKNPTLKILVAGYTDTSGDPETNVKLSQERANTVKSYLVKKGIPSNRVQSKGYGPKSPIATNDTAEGRAKNRRVEFLIQSAK